MPDVLTTAGWRPIEPASPPKPRVRSFGGWWWFGFTAGIVGGFLVLAGVVLAANAVLRL